MELNMKEMINISDLRLHIILMFFFLMSINSSLIFRSSSIAVLIDVDILVNSSDDDMASMLSDSDLLYNSAWYFLIELVDRNDKIQNFLNRNIMGINDAQNVLVCNDAMDSNKLECSDESNTTINGNNEYIIS